MRKIILLFLVSFSAAQTAVVLAPNGQFTSITSNGTANAFGCVFTYISGTLTPLASYTDQTGTVQNSNPVILNASGSANIWIKAGQAYTFLVKTFGGTNCATGVTVYSVNGIAGGTSQTVTTVPFSASPTFTVSAQIQVFDITLTGDAAAQPISFSGVSAPVILTFQITQDASGGHNWSWPANVSGGATVNSAANSTTTQTFVWNGTTTVATGPAETGSGPAITAGSMTVTGATNTQSLNNTQMCDQFAGATADVKINACIAALPSTGGTADARGLIGAQTVAAEIDVGNSTTKFVDLLLPCGATWTVTIAGGATSALKAFGGSSIIAQCAQNNGFILKAANTANVASMVTNDQTCTSCSVKIWGFMIAAANGTISNASLDLSNLGNNAEIGSLNIAGFPGKGLWIHSTNTIQNSESTFTAINVDGIQHGTPCTIESTGASLETMRFYGLDCQHPAAGNNLLVINGHNCNCLGYLTFLGSHFEGSNTDTTTPFVSITDAKAVSFINPFFNSLDSGTTNYGITIAQSAANETDGITMINAACPNGNCVNDTIRTKIISGNGILPFYSYSAANSNNGFIIGSGFALPEIAAPSFTPTGSHENCYGDSTQHVQRCKYNTGNYHTIALTEFGTCTMVAGTCTLTWGTAFASTPLCFAMWNGSGTLTGGLQAVPSTTNCIVTSTINTNTAVMQVLGIGNPN